MEAPSPSTTPPSSMPPKRKRTDNISGSSRVANASRSPHGYLESSSYYSGAGPSTSSAISMSYLGSPQPKAKKARTKKDNDTPLPEKRGAIFKRKCPRNIEDRVERVMSQRFFMVDRHREGNELKETFNVLGSTGNVYTVTICHTPSCTCPDAMKGNHCKHILFVYLKVLGVPMSSGHWYQKALLISELEEIFRNARPPPNSVSNSQIQEAYAKATGKPTKSTEVSAQNRKIPTEEDDCPICYETMHNVPEKNLVFDEVGCGNALHKECFAQWRTSQAGKGGELTCVWCRAKWRTSGGSGTASNTAAPSSSEGYLNLGAAAGLSPVRDTRTYYNGPSRGSSRYYGGSRGRYRYDFEELDDY